MRSLLLSAVLLMTAFAAQAQQNYGIAYQAVARDAGGDALENATLDVRFTLLDAASSAVWTETHTSVLTDEFGLINLTIGSVAGAGVGAALLPFSWTAAFFVDTWFPQVYSQEQDEVGLFVVHDGYDVAVMPMLGFGYVGGIAIGTPFYALYFPYKVTKNAIMQDARPEPGGNLELEFKERPYREERPDTPPNFPGG